MIKKIVLSNVVSEVSYLEKYFYSRPNHIITNGMKKHLVCGVDQDPEFVELLHDIIQNRIGITTPYEVIGDNFYEHGFSYFPHCDAVESNSWLNILIPIKLFDQRAEQKFIVFDQQYITGNATWMGSYDLKGDFLSNKKITKRICDTENVVNQTGKDIDDILYNDINKTYLSKDYLFSMSGDSFSWNPGDIIAFDSRFIHTTGTMNCSKKLGLSVRIGYKQ
jgi:hypothetical protein